MERYLNGSDLSSYNPIRGVLTKGCVPKTYGVDISADIMLLREYGLVFEEGDRLFSLLLEAEYGNRGKRVVHSHVNEANKRASHSISAEPRFQ